MNLEVACSTVWIVWERQPWEGGNTIRSIHLTEKGAQTECDRLNNSVAHKLEIHEDYVALFYEVTL